MPIEKLRQLETKSLNADLYKAELVKEQGALPLYVTPPETRLLWAGIGAGTMLLILVIFGVIN